MSISKYRWMNLKMLRQQQYQYQNNNFKISIWERAIFNRKVSNFKNHKFENVPILKYRCRSVSLKITGTHNVSFKISLFQIT